MSLIEKYIKGIRFLLPSPFLIAVLLTLFTFILAFFWPINIDIDHLNGLDKFINILNSWNEGLWNIQGLEFAVQMMLMLLLGHVLALSKLIDAAINRLLPFCWCRPRRQQHHQVVVSHLLLPFHHRRLRDQV